MPYEDDDDDDRHSWASVETVSSWIKSHKSSLHHSPTYYTRQYVPHLSPLYRATFKNNKRRRKRRDGAPSSGTASPVDWYYYSDTSSRNLSPLAYSPRVTKNSSTNTERPDDINDDSDAEFEPFPWVVFDDDDDVTTEPLFIDISGRRKVPPEEEEKTGLLITYVSQEDSPAPTLDEPAGDDSGIHSQTEESPSNKNDETPTANSTPAAKPDSLKQDSNHLDQSQGDDSVDEELPSDGHQPEEPLPKSSDVPRKDEPDTTTADTPEQGLLDEEEEGETEYHQLVTEGHSHISEDIATEKRKQKSSTLPLNNQKSKKPRSSFRRRFTIILLTTLALAAALVVMLYFPACCEKTEYLYGIPGLRIHYTSIPPH